jgi:pyrroline-5-carboxylate reductase
MTSIGFLGAGAMAQAMAKGLVAGKVFARFTFCDLNPAALEQCRRIAPGAVTTANKRQLVEADVIVLAVKPQVAPAVMASLAPLLAGRHLVVSIMAGLPIAAIRAAVGAGPRIVRCMPNAPLMVRCGATVFAADASATKADAALVTKMFESSGMCAELPEAQLDAVTGVSGSGPSFVAVFIDALADGAVKQGIPRPLAVRLAAHTVMGGGAMCAQGGVQPAGLRDMVCSPAGTSIYGVAALEKNGLRNAVIEAVAAAADRARELGKPKSKL